VPRGLRGPRWPRQSIAIRSLEVRVLRAPLAPFVLCHAPAIAHAGCHLRISTDHRTDLNWLAHDAAPLRVCHGLIVRFSKACCLMPERGGSHRGYRRATVVPPFRVVIGANHNLHEVVSVAKCPTACRLSAQPAEPRHTVLGQFLQSLAVRQEPQGALLFQPES
jgi:hypothetical protein